MLQVSIHPFTSTPKLATTHTLAHSHTHIQMHHRTTLSASVAATSLCSARGYLIWHKTSLCLLSLNLYLDFLMSDVCYIALKGQFDRYR